MSCVVGMKETPDLELMGDFLDDLREAREGVDQEPLCLIAPSAPQVALDPEDVPSWWLA